MKVSLGRKLAMSQNKKIGLITVLYNSPDILDDFFYSLSCQTFENFHLYVVDNSTIPEPLSKAKVLAKKYSIPVTFIDNAGSNVGVAKGNNQGAFLAIDDGCEYLGFINNDLIFIDPLVIGLLNQSLLSYDLVTPKIYSYPEGDVWFEEGYFDLGRGTTPHRIVGEAKDSIPYAPTCFLFCKVEVFKKSGMMDEWYFAYYDDSDFVYRAMLAGFKLGFIKGVSIQHKVSTSTGGSYSDFSLYYGTRNRIYFIRKNLKAFRPLLFTLFSRVVVLTKIKPKQYKLLLKAMSDGLRAKI